MWIQILDAVILIGFPVLLACLIIDMVRQIVKERLRKRAEEKEGCGNPRLRPGFSTESNRGRWLAKRLKTAGRKHGFKFAMPPYHSEDHGYAIRLVSTIHPERWANVVVDCSFGLRDRPIEIKRGDHVVRAYSIHQAPIVVEEVIRLINLPRPQ